MAGGGSGGGSGGETGASDGGGGGRRAAYIPVSFVLQPDAPFQYVWPRNDAVLLQLLAVSQNLLLVRILPAHIDGRAAAGQPLDDSGKLVDRLEAYTASALQNIEQWAAGVISYIDRQLSGRDEQEMLAFQAHVTDLIGFKQDLLEAQADARGVPAPERLLKAVFASRHFPAVLQNLAADARGSLAAHLQLMVPELVLAVSNPAILQPSITHALGVCLNRTTLLLRVLAAAERHGTLQNRYVFSLGGKSPIQSCSALVSHIATALAPACAALGSAIQLWLSSPHLSPRSRQCVSAAVSQLTVCAISNLTAALTSLAAHCTLQDFSCGSSSVPASTTTARLKMRLSERRVLADANGVSSHSGSTAGGNGSDAVAAYRATAALLEQEQREQQVQQARAAAKAAKRQRQKQRKAVEAAAAAAAAAAEAVPEQQGSAAELLAVAGTPPACPSNAAAAGSEPSQPVRSPEAPVRPAASGLDQLELLLAQLGLGGADCAGDEEGQRGGSGEGSGGTCLPAFPTEPPVQPSSTSTSTSASASSPEQSIESLLAQLGVGGSAAGSRPSSASGWASPAVSSSAAGAAAAARPAATADDDSLDALLVQLGVGSYSAEAISAAATGTSAHSAAAPAPAASLPTAATPASGLDPALLASLECPLTLQAMRQPVVAADGNTYERDAIAAWIERQQAAGQAPRSPLTNQPLGDLSLRPNRTLAGLIAGLRAGGQL